MTRYRIRHITRYKYAERVTRCYNLAHVLPRNTRRQRCLKSTVSVSPTPARALTRKDYFENLVYQFEIQKPLTELSITAESEVQVEERNPDPRLDLGATYRSVREYLATNLNPDTIDARQYLLSSGIIEIGESRLLDYARPSFDPDESLKSCVSDLTARIHSDFAYIPNSTTVATPLADVLEQKRGVCQDFAHLQIGCLRAVGIPARYVSGYIETLPKPGETKLVGADATHAWVAYYCPEEGWVEFDPTNNTQANSQHIVTAFGRDYLDVTPVRGVIFGGGRAPILEVSVDVARLA
jgi:transglutaminase-like putative cysteine protease